MPRDLPRPPCSTPAPLPARSARDSRAGLHLLAAHLPALHGFVARRCQGPLVAREAVADLVQWVCLEAVRRIDTFSGGDASRFRRWLFAIAENVIGNRIHYWRRAMRDATREAAAFDEATLPHPTRDSEDPVRAWISGERRKRVARALAHLPPLYADVIHKVWVQQMSHAEIAASLDRTPGAVRAILCRAMRRLRECVGAGRECAGDAGGGGASP